MPSSKPWQALLVSLIIGMLATPAAAALPPGGTFIDDDGNVHEGQIEAIAAEGITIAAEGITKGCSEDRHCPDDPVTRGQIAAFLRRALDLPTSGVDHFSDDDESVFADDIDAIATAGIARGCDPPDNDRYCPDRTLTRGQMAAMLVRAFGYTGGPGDDTFTDDDASVFEHDIDRLAAAAVRKGCGPGLFCPDQPVTRDQMASFLSRALGLPPIPVEPAVYVGPTMPDALRRELIPWNEVGEGWLLAMYDSSKVDTTPTEATPMVMYLSDPDGTLYEITSWGPDGAVGPIWDWRPDGRAALISWSPSASEVQPELRMIDLATGVSTTVHTGDGHGSFTRPTGENLIVFDDTPDRERLERRSTADELLAVLSDSPTTGFVDPWLYAVDGTELVVADDRGLHRISNTGADLAALWEPADRTCRPVRWWDAHHLLATCNGEIPPLIHEWYHQLWLIPLDGSPGTASTALPSEEVMVVDFGMLDAWPTDSGAIVQWLGDCSTAAVYRLLPNGTTTELDGLGVQSFVEVSNQGIVGSTWDGCGADRGAVWATDLAGHRLLELIPAVGDARGVGSVVGLATVHP